MGAFPATDERIAALAARQYGLVTRAQLVSLDVTRGSIRRRLQAGRLHRLHRGVYAVGHRAPRREARWLAAVLACGDGAVLSHRSAASLWTIREGEGPRPDVTIPTGSHRGHPGIVVHRAALHADDVTSHRGIPITSPERTLLDLSRLLDRDELQRAMREAQFQRRFDLAALAALLERRPDRTLRSLTQDLAVTQSGLEDRLLRICDRYGLPRPRTQHRIGARRLDFVWPEQRLIVETDDWSSHGTPSAFQADRSASNALQLDGYLVLRFTGADLRRRPAAVARQIAAALRRL